MSKLIKKVYTDAWFVKHADARMHILGPCGYRTWCGAEPYDRRCPDATLPDLPLPEHTSWCKKCVVACHKNDVQKCDWCNEEFQPRDLDVLRNDRPPNCRPSDHHYFCVECSGKLIDLWKNAEAVQA